MGLLCQKRWLEYSCLSIIISTWPAACAGPASVQHALCIRWMQDIVGQEWASCTCNLCLFGLELTTILPALEGLEIVVSLATFSLGNLWSFSWLPYSLLVLLTTSSTLNLVFHMTIYSTWLLCLLPLVMLSLTTSHAGLSSHIVTVATHVMFACILMC